MSLFPIFIKMSRRPALVVGGGGLAASKVAALIDAGAVVTVVAPSIEKEISDWHERGTIVWAEREFDHADLEGKAIVFAATGSREKDRAVFRACAEARVLCNAIDDPDFCDFYSPAIVRRGDLQIAISTNGHSPALAQQIRQELEVRFDAGWSDRVSELGGRRREVLAKMPSGPKRTAILREQARQAMNAGRPGVFRRITSAVSTWLNTEDDPVALI